MDAYIKAEKLTVEFPIYNSTNRSFRKNFLRASTGGRLSADAGQCVSVKALSEVDFTIQPGDRVGLMGHNGAGKTTLLRVLTGVYKPISGTLETKGRVVSLLDINLGMESEATGVENIFLRGILMGLTPKEIDARIDEIAEFSELGQYLNVPIRTYSSGMLLRLAFSVSICVQSDILLMDEWLSVGDKHFNEKASAKLEALVSETSIMVMASHSKQTIQKNCNRVFHLKEGNLIELSFAELDAL